MSHTGYALFHRLVRKLCMAKCQVSSAGAVGVGAGAGAGVIGGGDSGQLGKKIYRHCARHHGDAIRHIINTTGEGTAYE